MASSHRQPRNSDGARMRHESVTLNRDEAPVGSLARILDKKLIPSECRLGHGEAWPCNIGNGKLHEIDI